MNCNCEFGSIRDIHKRLVHEGYNIAEHTLRMWVKNGTISAIYSGKKALISYANVISIITM